MTKELPGSPGTQPLGEAEYDTLTELALTLLPAATAVSWMAALLFNLWLAARITLASGRLQRPWPDLAAITFPPGTPLLLAASTAASFAPGHAGLAAAGFAGSFYLAYVLLGLAVVHYTARTQLAPVRLVGTLRRARPYQHRPVAPDRDPRAHRADDLVAPTHRSAAIRRALHLNSPEWQPKPRGDPNASHPAGTRRQARPDGRRRHRQGRLRAQLPAAAEEGPARQQGQPRPVRAAALAARGQQSRAQEGGRGGGREARRQVVCRHPLGRRYRAALRLGVPTRHRRRRNRGRFHDRPPPGRARPAHQDARRPPGDHQPTPGGGGEGDAQRGAVGGRGDAAGARRGRDGRRRGAHRARDLQPRRDVRAGRGDGGGARSNLAPAQGSRFCVQGRAWRIRSYAAAAGTRRPFLHILFRVRALCRSTRQISCNRGRKGVGSKAPGADAMFKPLHILLSRVVVGGDVVFVDSEGAPHRFGDGTGPPVRGALPTAGSSASSCSIPSSSPARPTCRAASSSRKAPSTSSSPS